MSSSKRSNKKNKDVYTNEDYIHFLYKCFYDLHNLLIQHNIPYYASSGTLLGAMRHGGIIPWDDDVDLEISYKDVDKVLSKEFKNDCMKKGYVVRLHRESKYEYDWIKINSIKKVDGRISSIDLFIVQLGRDEKGKYRTYLMNNYLRTIWPKFYVNYEEMFPLRQVKFGKGVIFAPNKPDKILKRLYGKKWNKEAYITLDQDHYELDEPIRVYESDFKPAKRMASAKHQIRLNKNDILLTSIGSGYL